MKLTKPQKFITWKTKENNMKMGKAQYGSRNVSRKYFKLKDGEQAFRILPPLGDLADEGRWSVFHSVHYGYKTSDGKQKPFISPEVKNRKTNMIEVADAAKDRITTLKAKWEEARKDPESPVFKKLNDLVGPTGMYNLDNNHYMNVIDAQGNIGILKLRHKAKLALEAQIKSLGTDGVDPLSADNGRFFVFTRTGKGRDTTFGVHVLKEKMTVAGVGLVERDVVHSLDEETIKRLAKEAGELDKLFRKPTGMEVKRIVDSSDLMTGVSTFLDQMFAKKSENAEAAQDDGDGDTPDAQPEPAQAQAAPVAAAPAPQAAAPTPAPVAQAAAPAPKATPPKAAAPKTTAAALNEMSQDDFIAALNNGTL
jgi:glucan-binding YG repeat protein